MNDFHSFFERNFPNLPLRPPLFYLWDVGIRFEISIPWVEHENRANLQQIKERSNTILRTVLEENNEVFLVTDIHCGKHDRFLQKKPVNVYRKYVRDKKLIRNLTHIKLPSVFTKDEDHDQMATHRFVLQCKMKDIKSSQLLHAISFEDFYHPSQILKGNCRAGYDIYFVNITKKIIYHLYDDRGCDVIAADKEDLRKVYEKLGDWVLEYDREKVERLFHLP